MRPRNFGTTGRRRAARGPLSGTGVRPGVTGSSQQWSEAMALPSIRAIGPEKLQLPDVRRLDRMPFLPAWVASRVESMKDVSQATASGRHEMVPTLPANLTLTLAERAEIDRHIGDLEALCAQTPIAAPEWEGATLITVTKLMLAL